MKSTKLLKIITCTPGNLQFTWETEVLCNNLREIGLSTHLQVLIDLNSMNDTTDIWFQLAERYQEVEFFSYSTNEVEGLLIHYPPIVRLNILKQHFKRYEKLEQNTIFYIDTDVLLKQEIIEVLWKFKDNNINYLSKTDYISATYFKSKEQDTMMHCRKEFKTRDILNELCAIMQIRKELVEYNNDNSGGAQYLLKNIARR